MDFFSFSNKSFGNPCSPTDAPINPPAMHKLVSVSPP